MKKKQNAINLLLALVCSETSKPIKVGEIVALHNWGANTEVIGYGSFQWNEQERSFSLDYDRMINDALGTPSFHGVEDSYDLFRTSPRKLTAREKKVIS